MPGADCALTDTVCNICIYARPIHRFSSLGLHPINSLMSSMQISKGPIEQFQWYTYPCPLKEKASVNGKFIPNTPKVLGNVGNFLNVLRPSSKG